MQGAPERAGLPWWFRITAKIVLSRLPVDQSTWQRIGLFRHGAMDDPAYSLEVFRSHTRRVEKDTLKGLRILELGPGNSIATGLIAAAHGATAVLVDVGDFATDDVRFYVRLAGELRRRGFSTPDINDCTSTTEVLDRCGAEYHSNGLESLRSIPSASIDLIFSQAVLEHVRSSVFEDTMVELRRILSPGATSSHRVDLRDHLGGGLDNLRFVPRIWESDFFADSGFYTNRMGLQQMRDVFMRTHECVDITRINRWDTLPLRRDRMHRSFRERDDADLRVQGFDVTMRPAQDPDRD